MFVDEEVIAICFLFFDGEVKESWALYAESGRVADVAAFEVAKLFEFIVENVEFDGFPYV